MKISQTYLLRAFKTASFCGESLRNVVDSVWNEVALTFRISRVLKLSSSCPSTNMQRHCSREYFGRLVLPQIAQASITCNPSCNTGAAAVSNLWWVANSLTTAHSRPHFTVFGWTALYQCAPLSMYPLCTKVYHSAKCTTVHQSIPQCTSVYHCAPPSMCPLSSQIHFNSLH